MVKKQKYIVFLNLQRSIVVSEWSKQVALSRIRIVKPPNIIYVWQSTFTQINLILLLHEEKYNLRLRGKKQTKNVTNVKRGKLQTK